MFQEMNPMDKTTAWLEITIIVLVAFLIGFIISWLYWRWKRKNELSAANVENVDTNNLENETKKYIMELEVLKTENEKLQKELSQAKEELATAVNVDNKDNCCAEKDELIVKCTELKKALEEKTREAEENFGLYEKLFDLVDQGITMSNKEGDFIIYNKKMEELAGYTKDDANNAPFFLACLYPDPADRDYTANDIDQLEENVASHFVDTAITNKNGEKVDLHVSSGVVKWNEKNYFLSAFKKD